MQVAGLESIRRDVLPIFAGIMIVGRMEGLMQVADQMEDEFQRDEPFFGISFRIGKFGCELLDLIDNASLCRAIRCDHAGQQRASHLRFPSAPHTDPRV